MIKSMLAVGLSEQDRDETQRILAPRGWGIREIAGYLPLAEQLRRHRFAAVLCESELIDGTWRDVLEELTTLAPAPPLIVTSFLADASLWAEVLNCGGFDVVRVPFEAEELARVAALASEGNRPVRTGRLLSTAFACVD
jgi:DNA-binding NtrC family response regulator